MDFRIRDCLELDTGAGRMRPMKFLRGVAVFLRLPQHHAMQSILHIKLYPLGAEVAAVLRNFDTRGLAANLAGLAALTVGDWSSPSQLGRAVMETLAPSVPVQPHPGASTLPPIR